MFVGSSTERLGSARRLAEHFAPDRDTVEVFVWDAIFGNLEYPLEALTRTLNDWDFAALIWGGEDRTDSRSTVKASPRDNLIFELGLFMGRIGRRRCFILHPNQQRPELPSDLRGVVYLEYDAGRPEGEEQQALNTPALKMAAVIREFGSRTPGL